MTGHPFDDIVDRCIADVLAGRALADVLADWPEHREDLEPLLRTVLALQEATPPPPAPDPARRAALMAQVRQTPQQRPRRRLPALPALSAFGGLPLRFATVSAATAVALVFLLGLSLLRGGPTVASAATLTIFAGAVERQVDGRWLPVDDGAGLESGDTVRTAADGRALITFADGSTASLDPLTQVTLARIVLGDLRDIEIDQASGRLWNDVASDVTSGRYLVRTPHAVVEASSTIFQTIVDGETAVATASGHVQVTTAQHRVSVDVGQMVRANTAAISDPIAAPVIGHIVLHGPLVAGISDSHGIATGVLPTGVTFNQIPGITTSPARDGMQRITAGSIEPGVYSLWLRRLGPGDGMVSIETQTGDTVVPVPDDVTTGMVLLAIDVVEGSVFMRVLATELEPVVRAAPLPQVRVVPSQRTRAAVELPTGRGEGGSAAVVTLPAIVPTTAPDGRADSDDRAPGRDDDRDSDRRNESQDGSDARGPDRAPEATTPTVTPAASDDRRGDERRNRPPSWSAQWNAAVRAGLEGDRVTLVLLLNSMLEDEAARVREERLALLADSLRNPRTRAMISEVIAAGETPQLMEALPEALERTRATTRSRILAALPVVRELLRPLPAVLPDVLPDVLPGQADRDRRDLIEATATPDASQEEHPDNSLDDPGEADEEDEADSSPTAEEPVPVMPLPFFRR